jgi:hypothetical protein
MNDILLWFFGFWFISIPLTILIIYTVVTELLDLIFNSSKISRLLKHSDSLKSDLLEKEYTIAKERQNKVDQSNLIELNRQIEYKRLMKNKISLTHKTRNEEKEKLTAAKEISDVFKIK